MQRWTGLLFAAITAGFVAALFVFRPGAAPGPGPASPLDAGTADAAHDGAAPASAVVPPASSAGRDGGEATAAEVPEEADPSGEARSTSDAGITLLSGEAAPGLSAEAPKSVVFGVVLITYRGAQGAPPTARTREAALELAKQLAVDAKQDFKAAVAKGDKGSMENAGRMPRGMLEPAPEYVLFSLPKDGVSDPVDTPRGFWITRRID